MKITTYQKNLLLGAALGIAGLGIAARVGFAKQVTGAVVPPGSQVTTAPATTTTEKKWWNPFD